MTGHIAIYGKGGVGKSTLMANISAAMTEAGFKVLLVGCSTNAESCALLNGGLAIPTVSDSLRSGDSPAAGDLLRQGFKGAALLELGVPADRAAGSSDATLAECFDWIEAAHLIENTHADYVLYDISGNDLLEQYYQQIRRVGNVCLYLATTADYLALRAVNGFIAAIGRLGREYDSVLFGGLIPNAVSNSFEDTFIADFAGRTSSHLLGHVPRSLMVRQCELYGKTVIEAAHQSNQSYYYRRLANQMVDISTGHGGRQQPRAMADDKLREWAAEWGDRLYALENGLVADGAAI